MRYPGFKKGGSKLLDFFQGSWALYPQVWVQNFFMAESFMNGKGTCAHDIVASIVLSLTIVEKRKEGLSSIVVKEQTGHQKTFLDKL